MIGEKGRSKIFCHEACLVILNCRVLKADKYANIEYVYESLVKYITIEERMS